MEMQTPCETACSGWRCAWRWGLRLAGRLMWGGRLCVGGGGRMAITTGQVWVRWSAVAGGGACVWLAGRGGLTAHARRAPTAGAAGSNLYSMDVGDAGGGDSGTGSVATTGTVNVTALLQTEFDAR